MTRGPRVGDNGKGTTGPAPATRPIGQDPISGGGVIGSALPTACVDVSSVWIGTGVDLFKGIET